MFRYLTGSLGVVVDPPEIHIVGVLTTVTPFLILHAFSSGTSALTGIEAISNGITAFREPRSKNAGITLIWMALILASLFLGITFLARQVHAVPSEVETVISQITRTIFGGQYIFYLAVLVGTAIILILAANTAFADFPRLSALHAGDGFLPRQFTYRGSRLVFSTGIVALAVVASLLIILFQASVTRLIPLYAIGVFLSFTLSQTGMARRWWKAGHLEPGVEIKEPGSILHYDKHWLIKMIINGFGAIATFIVMIVFAITKFKDGAWIVIVLTPTLVMIFFSIHHHYKNLARQLSLGNEVSHFHASHNRVIIPISGVHQGTLAALRFARTLSEDVTVVHVSNDPAEADKIRKKWEVWGDGIRLVILNSPYRLLVEPLLAYLTRLETIRQPNEILTIVVPQFKPRHSWENILHMRTAETST